MGVQVTSEGVTLSGTYGGYEISVEREVHRLSFDMEQQMDTDRLPVRVCQKLCLVVQKMENLLTHQLSF